VSVSTVSKAIKAWLAKPPASTIVVWGTRATHVIVLGLFAFGVLMLATLVRASYVAIGVVVVGLLGLLFDRWIRWRRLRALLLILVVPLVGIVTLLGFNVACAQLGIPRPDARIGLAIAAVVVGGSTYSYLSWLGERPPAHIERWLAGAALAALVLGTWTFNRVPELKLWLVVACLALALWVYLTYGTETKVRAPSLWALLTVIVLVAGAPLVVAVSKDHKVNAVVAGVVVAAFLFALAYCATRPGDQPVARIGAYVMGGVVVGVVLVLAILTFTADETPAGEPQQIATADPSVRVSDLARRYRPVLLFDSGERLRTPLNVEEILDNGYAELCPTGGVPLATCPDVSGAKDLRNNVGNLRLDTAGIEDADISSTMYVHQLRDPFGADAIYLDYWWYLADNPANTARGAMCGAGLVIPEITCFDHQSDWEGATVVVTASSNEPVAVHYSLHDKRMNVPWNLIEKRPSDHPVVYVALGTHAAYPVKCEHDVCDRGAAIEDNSHDGVHEWQCDQDSCLTALPVRGRDGASWNGFDGYWGEAICFKGVYCSRSDGPRAPGRQPRFRMPWCYNLELLADRRHTRTPRQLAHCPSK
jgi:hypothetical protein